MFEAIEEWAADERAEGREQALAEIVKTMLMDEKTFVIISL